MKELIIMAVMAVTVTAYKNGRRYSATSALEDFLPYQGAHQHQPLYEQHHPFREQSLRTQQYQSYRHRPYRQDLSSYPEQLSFRDHSLFKHYSSLKGRPIFGDSSNFKEQVSSFAHGMPSKDQAEKNRTTFGNEQAFQDLTLADRYSSYGQHLADDLRLEDLYNKATSSFKGQLASQRLNPFGSFGEDSEHLKNGNHGLGYVYVSTISPYENALPLKEEASTTMPPSMTPVTTHKPLQQSTVSSMAPAITQVHTSATSESKMASLKASHTVTMPTVKSNTPVDGASSGASTPAVPSTPAAPVIAKQSSNLAHLPVALTNESSLPVIPMESPIVSFGRHALPSIEIQASKFSTPMSHYHGNGSNGKLLQQSLLSYLLLQQAKEAIKANEQTSLLSQALPDASGNSLNTKIQSSALNYVLPDELSAKDNLQNSLLNSLLQQELNRGLSLQQPSLSETVNYVPLGSLAERPRITLPIATLSAVSRPLQAINYVSTTLPRVPAFATRDTSVSSALPLGTTLSSGLFSNVAHGQLASAFNSLPGGASGSVSADIPGSLSTTVPVNIPTSNFAQNCQHPGQLRQLEPATSQPLSTGLQLQLGGFGGIDYTLRSANPVSRFTDLGIAKVGLSFPELPRHQLPTFPKVGLEQRLWQT